MKRPFGVTLIGALLLIQGVVLVAEVAAGVWLLLTRGSEGARPALVVSFAGLALNEWLSAAVVGALSIFSVAVGVGVLWLRPWAWFAAMALQGWTLATLLLDYFTRGHGNYASMLLGVVIVFYLNTRAVREPFDLARSRSDAGTNRPSSAAQSGAPVETDQVTTPLRRAKVSDTAADG